MSEKNIEFYSRTSKILMENIKVLCIGDSTALPGHANVYEDTWFYKLKKAFPLFDFISVFRRAITTNILISEGGGDSKEGLPNGADCLEHYMPNVVILQLGIVDCAPRLFRSSSLEYKIINRFPEGMKKGYIAFIKKTRKRRISNVEVLPAKFQQNLKSFLERCYTSKVQKVVFIEIPYPTNAMVSKNPDIITNINFYNSIIEGFGKKFEIVRFVNPLDSRKSDEIIFDDGYHPNPRGNAIVFESLKTELER